MVSFLVGTRECSKKEIPIYVPTVYGFPVQTFHCARMPGLVPWTESWKIQAALGGKPVSSSQHHHHNRRHADVQEASLFHTECKYFLAHSYSSRSKISQRLTGKLNYPSSLSRSSLLLATRSFPRRPDIIMTENTFHRVKEDIRKPESRLSGFHRGKTPADSDVSALKVSSRSPLKGATLYRVPVT